jgi:SAM-dependent methyltransferase
MTALGADPRLYEDWLGEATELMLDQAGVGPGSRVLDVAAGQTPLPGAFDAAICRLGLMHLPDVAAALRGVRLALRPGGRFSAVVYDDPALAAIAGPQDPFALSASGALRALLEDAGFTDVEIEHVDAPLNLPDDVCVPFRLLVGGGRRSC